MPLAQSMARIRGNPSGGARSEGGVRPGHELALGDADRLPGRSLFPRCGQASHRNHVLRVDRWLPYARRTCCQDATLERPACLPPHPPLAPKCRHLLGAAEGRLPAALHGPVIYCYTTLNKNASSDEATTSLMPASQGDAVYKPVNEKKSDSGIDMPRQFWYHRSWL